MKTISPKGVEYTLPVYTPKVISDDHTLERSDLGPTLHIDKSTVVNVTVPPDTTIDFDVGTRIPFLVVDSGNLQIAEGSGVTVNSAGDLLTSGQYAEAWITKLEANTWLFNSKPGVVV